MEENEAVRVGVVGVGNMGSLVVRRLLGGGVPTAVYDIDAAATGRLVAEGATAAGSARALAESCTAVLTVLPSAAATEAAYAGEDGILAGAHVGLVCVEMGTTHPDVVRRTADLASAHGVDLVAVALGGSARSNPAEQASGEGFVLMAGGPEAAVERVRPVLDVLGSHVAYCGSAEDAVTMKVLNNLLAGLTLACNLEVLALGRKRGLDVASMLDVFTRTAADNARLHVMIPQQVLRGDWTPGLALRLSRKDTDLALDLAREVDVPLVFGTRLHELRTMAVNRGLGDLDQSALARLVEELTGAEIR